MDIETVKAILSFYKIFVEVNSLDYEFADFVQANGIDINQVPYTFI